VVNAPREEVLGEAQVLWVRIGLTYSRQAGAESRFEAALQMLKQAVERTWNDVILSEAKNLSSCSFNELRRSLVACGFSE